ncbi:MAG: 30S ribosomal protein S17 [Chloroflexi bacterium]|nr:30S ribosomal protein S17 [Chloroflexota bacterium]
MEAQRKRLIGRVTSNKMEKTVVVRVEQVRQHRLYGKVMRIYKNYKAHDEAQCQEGDLVRIVEARPMSREKRWQVEEVLERADSV